MFEIGTRRDFLRTSAAAVVLSSLFREAALPSVNAEEQKVENTAEIRSALFAQIGTCVESGTSFDERRAQMIELREMVPRYRDLLKAAPADLTYDELQKAVDFTYIKLNMTHYSDGQDKADVHAYVSAAPFPLYETLTDLLIPIAAADGPSKTAAAAALEKIRGDLIWSKIYDIDTIDLRSGEMIVEKFLRDTKSFTLANLQAKLPFDHRPDFYLPLLRGCREQIGEICDRAIARVLDGTDTSPADTVTRYLGLHRCLQKARSCAADGGLLTRDESAQVSKWVTERLEHPFLEHFFKLHQAVLKSDHLPADLYCASVKSMPASTPSETLAKSVVEFLGRAESSVVMRTGEQYVAGLQQWMKEGKPGDFELLRSFRLLAYLPTPQPAHAFITEKIFDWIERGLRVDDMVSRAPPALGTALLADYLAPLPAGKSPESVLSDQSRWAVSMTRQKETPKNADEYTAIQRIVAALGWAAAHQNIAGAFPAACFENSAEERAALRRVELVLLNIAEDVWTMGGAELFSKDPGMDSLNPPADWGPIAIVADGRMPPKELKVRFTEFARLIDGTVSEMFRPRAWSLEGNALVDRALLLSRLLVPKISDRDPSTLGFLPEVLAFRESFPPISIRSRNGPFVHVFHKARNLLYQRSFDSSSPGPYPLKVSEQLVYKTDKRVDQQAYNFAETAEQVFICDLIIALWPPNNRRRFDQHVNLSDSKMAREMRVFLAVLGFEDRHPDVHRVLGSSTPAEIPTELLALRDRLAASRDAQWVNILTTKSRR